MVTPILTASPFPLLGLIPREGELLVECIQGQVFKTKSARNGPTKKIEYGHPHTHSFPLPPAGANPPGGGTSCRIDKRRLRGCVLSSGSARGPSTSCTT